jgi:superfamily II DNA helicase RecQ
MPLLTQFASFFISPFGEASVCEELNHFLRSHRIVNVDKRLVDGERGTGWLFLVEYGAEMKTQTANATRVDYRELLTEQEYVLFDKLRETRKTISEKQGVPVYAVFTNDQLAAMVKKSPATLKDIQAIPGVGEARVKQYGEAILTVFLDAAGKTNETPKQSV